MIIQLNGKYRHQQGLIQLVQGETTFNGIVHKTYIWVKPALDRLMGKTFYADNISLQKIGKAVVIRSYVGLF